MRIFFFFNLNCFLLFDTKYMCGSEWYSVVRIFGGHVWSVMPNLLSAVSRINRHLNQNREVPATMYVQV